MRISVDVVDGLLLADLAAPPVRVENEEELIVSEMIESR